MLQRFLDPATLASISSPDRVARVPLLKSGHNRIVNRYEGASIARDNSATSALFPTEDEAPGQLTGSPRLTPRLCDSAFGRRPQ